MKVVLTNTAKKILACFLAVILAIPLISIPTTVYGANFNDIRGHWAESYINKAVSAGFVKGYPDGTYHPDDAVTRAEFTSMVNKALGNTGTTSVNFTDVPYNEWYYNDVAKGVSASFVGGYDNNTFRPNTAVTREEAAVMVARFVPTYGSTGSISSFKDKSSISTWATDSVAKIYGKGYMGAYDDGKYHPQDSLTRAQTAKIICGILDKENIVSSSTIVKSKGTTLSGRIYSNNVTMHSDLGSGDAELSNCVVLGTLYVYGGGEGTITVENSRVANAYVEKSSSSVRVLAKGQTVINKATTGNKAILETSSLSGGLYGTGFNELDIKGSAETTLKGSFIKVNVTGSSANVDIESGSITTFNVSSSGRNSDINVNSKASIGTANVNASAAFRGSGTINTMNANSSGITYETKPKYLKMGSGVSSPDYSDSEFDIEISPKNKATKVKVDTTITLTFKTAVTKYNGSTIKNSDISDMVYLRKGSSSGSKVSFSGSISSNKKVLTLTPDSNLDDDTKYYVVIPKKEFLNTKDEGNDAQTTYFTTGDDSDGTVKFSPKSGATDVSRSVDPTLTFSEAIETYAGKTITESYIQDNIIFREGSSSGSKVTFDGSINSSKKTITLDPRSTLKEGQKYYISIPSKKFRTRSDGTNIGSYSVTWTTSSPSAPSVSFNPANGATNVALNSSITLEFSTGIYDTSGNTPNTNYLSNNITLRDNTGGSNISFSGSISNSSNKAVITLKPSVNLTAGRNYTISVASGKFRNSSAVYMGSVSASFTTLRDVDLSSLDASINNANSAKQNTKISTTGTGSDIFEGLTWVTQAQWDTINAAINTATNAKATVATTALAQEAAKVLDAATKTFTDSKKPGTKIRVDISALNYAISDAKAAKNGISISTDGFDISPNSKWVTKEAVDLLNNAIASAEAALDTVDNANQVLSYTTSLNSAVDAFRSKVSSGNMADKTTLNSTIKSANNKISGVRIQNSADEVPVNATWVTSDEYKIFSDAIANALTVYQKREALQSEVNKAVSDLNQAINSFNPKPGTKVE